jgi:hypothetical protein
MSEPKQQKERDKPNPKERERNQNEEQPAKTPALQSENAENDHYQGRRQQPQKTGRIKTFLEIIGIVLLFAYTLFQGFQLVVSRDTERRQLRAYIGIIDIGLQCCSPIGADPINNPSEISNVVTIIVKNGGITPASNVRTYTNWGQLAFNTAFPTSMDYNDAPREAHIIEASLLILPGGERRFNHAVTKSISLFRAAKDRKVRAMIYGHIDYTDIFGRERQTLFCTIYSVTNIGADNNESCPEHNGEGEIPSPWYSRILFGP